MNSTSKVILGIVGAAAAGVVIGLLLAPDKGSETRRRIGKTAGNWANSLTHIFDKHVDDLAATVQSAKTTAETKANKSRESFS